MNATAEAGFLCVGTKLKASASEPEFFVLFEKPVPTADRERTTGALPVAVTASVAWSDRLLVFGGDSAFRAALRDTLGGGGPTALDAALAAWAVATHAHNAIACFVSIDGKGMSVPPKRLAQEVVLRVVGPLSQHFAETPADTRGASLLCELVSTAMRSAKSIDEPTFVALAIALERALGRCDQTSALQVLAAHQELVERAPEGAEDRAQHAASFRLAKLLKAHQRDEAFLERVRSLAAEVDPAGALPVARVAVWLLGGGPSLGPAERFAVGEALLAGPAIQRRTGDGVSVGDKLAAAAASCLSPFMRSPSEDEVALAKPLLELAERYADAQPNVAAAAACLRNGETQAALKLLGA